MNSLIIKNNIIYVYNLTSLDKIEEDKSINLKNGKYYFKSLLQNGYLWHNKTITDFNNLNELEEINTTSSCIIVNDYTSNNDIINIGNFLIGEKTLNYNNYCIMFYLRERLNSNMLKELKFSKKIQIDNFILLTVFFRQKNIGKVVINESINFIDDPSDLLETCLNINEKNDIQHNLFGIFS